MVMVVVDVGVCQFRYLCFCLLSRIPNLSITQNAVYHGLQQYPLPIRTW